MEQFLESILWCSFACCADRRLRDKDQVCAHGIHMKGIIQRDTTLEVAKIPSAQLS